MKRMIRERLMKGAGILQNVFFFHNPKAGGMSIANFLKKQFTPDRTAPLIENDTTDHERLAGSYKQFVGYGLYHGHYGRNIFNAVNKGHQPTTNFRYPPDRLLSLYNYFRYAVPGQTIEGDPDRYFAVSAARSLTIDEFLLSDDPRIAVYTSNYHSRQLSRSGWSLEKGLPVEKVIGFIDTMPWFYICEEPEASIAWASRWLGCQLPRMERLNETVLPIQAQVECIEGNLLTAVLNRNADDLKIFNHSLAIVGKRP
jgi:hypothetical protein